MVDSCSYVIMKYHGIIRPTLASRDGCGLRIQDPGNSWSRLVVDHRIFGGSSFDPLSELSGRGVC